MQFDKINKIGRLDDFLPTKKLSELEEHKVYKLTAMKTVKTKYGESIIVGLDGEFSMFLPARISKLLLDGDQAEFHNMKKRIEDGCGGGGGDGAVNLHLRYLGGGEKFKKLEFLDIPSH